MTPSTHGIDYHPSFLDSLPVLNPPPSQPSFSTTPEQVSDNQNVPTGKKIRALAAAQFASLHLKHILAHPPDTVLFPFLHGLEGDNEAQNLFFGVDETSETPVPRYRGLVWVVCEDDLTPDQRRKLFKRRNLVPHSPAVAEPASSSKKRREGGDVVMGSGDSSESEDLDDDDDLIGSDDLDYEDDEDDESLYSDDLDEEGFADEGVVDGAYLDGDGKEVARAVQIDDTLVSGADTDEDSDASSPSSEGMQVTPLMPCAPPLPPVSPAALQSPVLGAGDGMDIDVEMDIDSGAVAVGVGLQGVKKLTEAEREEGTHMHPVAQRQGRHTQSLFEDAIPPPLDIPVTSPPSSQSSQQSLASHAIPSTHALTSQPSQSSLPTSMPQTPSRSRSKRARTPPLLTSSFRPSELLKRVAESWESVQSGSKGADKWDFIPLKVPDGISLRNFGIQVPVYATLSDIVVYSPKGASPAAIALAKRFSEAVERKRTWRRERAEEVRRTSGEIPRDGEDDEGRFLEYNVFVLDADAEALRRGLPHLVVRVCAPGGILSPEKAKTHDDSASRSGGATDVLDDRHHDAGAHTVGSDGRVDAMDVFDCEVEDAASKPSAHTLDPDSTGTGVLIDGLPPNTVDFALREKEEMRDLTRASEIITVYPASDARDRSDMRVDGGRSRKALPVPVHHAGGAAASKDDGPVPWAPELGQVFLGNADDVPLMRDPDGPMMHFHSGGPGRKGLAGEGLDLFSGGGGSPGADGDVDMRGERLPYGEGDGGAEGVEEDLPEDDPFNYLPTNDPGKSMGYDICFECHDRAPYPSPAHLRAAEEHLGMLEVMWARRCMERENTRIQRSRSHPNWKSRRSEVGQAIPPRPPPNANAVIHLPFPSSPPFNSSRMSSLMSVLDFIEKWLQPPTTPVVLTAPTHAADSTGADGLDSGGAKSHGRRWSTVSSMFPSFGPAGSSFFPSASPSTSEPATAQAATTPVPAARNRSFTSPPTPHIPSDHRHEQHGTGPSAQDTRTLGLSSTAISAHTLSFSAPPSSPLTRPLKILIYSNDGYTESSGAALSLLMKLKGLKLPEAYLELQVAKRRSFFVYGDDLGVLRKVEQRIVEEHERERRRRDEERERERQQERHRAEREKEKRDKGPAHVKQADDKHGAAPNGNAVVGRGGVKEAPGGNDSRRMMGAAAAGRRPAAKSVSFAQAPVLLPPPPSSAVPPALSSVSASGTTSAIASPTQASHGEDADPPVPTSVMSALITPINIATSGPSTVSIAGPTATSAPGPAVPASSPYTPGHGHGHGHVTFSHSQVVKGRPRANTSPWLPSLFGDHQSWFNDPRFDGSFPSRVLPFLYLGNLNHASNAYMLHALGITHVVSVGECALVPPPHLNNYHNNAHAPQTSLPNAGHFVPGKGHGGQGSLWTEEREGRIKVLDIKGICDDGIDTLEPQLEPICEWIDRARAEGGRVLVHCRVGVSRSATVVIAYVMKHLHLPLVDAYLIVRSRRLSVLIQPNMRLLYNLCGWEIKLAKERAGEDEKKLIAELSRAVSWPWLAKEVHKLNEKYITA